MKKYHVAVEAIQPSAFSAFSPLGFGIKYYTATIDDGQPVNAETLYNLINENQERKTGPVIAWSRIE
jgi:hypothetical protein